MERASSALTLAPDEGSRERLPARPSAEAAVYILMEMLVGSANIDCGWLERRGTGIVARLHAGSGDFHLSLQQVVTND